MSGLCPVQVSVRPLDGGHLVHFPRKQGPHSGYCERQEVGVQVVPSAGAHLCPLPPSSSLRSWALGLSRTFFLKSKLTMLSGRKVFKQTLVNLVPPSLDTPEWHLINLIMGKPGGRVLEEGCNPFHDQLHLFCTNPLLYFTLVAVS